MIDLPLYPSTPPVLHVALIRLEDLLVVPDGLLELLALHIALGAPEERLGVAGVQIERLVAVGDALVHLLLLCSHGGAIEVELGIGAPVTGVYQESLAEIEKSIKMSQNVAYVCHL